MYISIKIFYKANIFYILLTILQKKKKKELSVIYCK